MGDDARTKGVHVRLSKNELDYWKLLADTAGKTLSQFILGPMRLMYPAKTADEKSDKKVRQKRK